jgi:hypothetical protein
LLKLVTYALSPDDIKSIIVAGGLNSFRVQIRLVHHATTIDGVELIHSDYPIWQTNEIIECKY